MWAAKQSPNRNTGDQETDDECSKNNNGAGRGGDSCRGDNSRHSNR